jgi:EmrB/QacA subfamily drug resistance transporter
MVRRVLHKNYILLIIAAAQFMVILDTSIVNVALPSIFKALHYTSESNLQWVVTAYTLAFGGFLLLGGRAADLYGRKKLFVISVAAFTTLSFLCGIAQSSIMLDITRALQGLTAAFLSPAALSIILTTFREGKERAKALSVWGAVAAGGAAFGVLLGGVLTQYLDWRWNFFVNIPVGIAVFLAAWHYVPESKADLDHSKLDLPGAAAVTAGLISLVYAITQAPSWGWSDTRTLGFLSAAVVLLGYFIFHESRIKHALMPLSIFKVGNVWSANVAQLPMTAAMFAMFFFVSIYVQNVLGYSPVKTGLSFLPVPFTIGIVSTVMSRVVNKVGYKIPLVTGPLFVSAALFFLSHISVGGNYWTDVFPGLVLMALGMGQVFISVTIAATAGVPPRESGLASGILNTSQQIGGAIGLAILSGVATAGVKSYMSSHAAGSAGSAGVAAAQVNGFQDAFFVAAFFPLVTSLVAFLFVKVYAVDEKAEPAIAA